MATIQDRLKRLRNGSSSQQSGGQRTEDRGSGSRQNGTVRERLERLKQQGAREEERRQAQKTAQATAMQGLASATTRQRAEEADREGISGSSHYFTAREEERRADALAQAAAEREAEIKAREEALRLQDSGSLMDALMGTTDRVQQGVEALRRERESTVPQLTRKAQAARSRAEESRALDYQRRLADIMGAEDFKEYAARGAAFRNPEFSEAQMNALGMAGTEPVNIVTYSRDNLELLEGAEVTARMQGKPVTGRSIYQYLTDDEVSVYNYLLAREGKRQAQGWLDYLEDRLQERQGAGETAQLQELSDEMPVLMSALSVGNNIATAVPGALDVLAQTARSMAGGERANYNSQAQREARRGSTIRGTVAQGIAESSDFDVLGINVPSMLYQTAMSGADSLAAGLAGAWGGAVILGASAGVDAAQDAHERGASDGQAAVSGIMAGVFETLFERVSIGELKAMQEVPVRTLRDVAENVVKSVVTNASEETLTEIANVTFDTLWMGGLSSYALAVEGYMDQGMSEEEARRQAVLDLTAQVVEAGVSGGIMGAGFGVVGSGTSLALEALDRDGRAQTEAAPETEAAQPEADVTQAAVEALLRGEEISGKQADRILEEPEAVARLEAEAGLELQEGMTKAQRRAAVRALAENTGEQAQEAGKPSFAPEETQDTGGTAEAFTAAQEGESGAAPARRAAEVSAAMAARNLQSVRQAAAESMGRQGQDRAAALYDGRSDPGSWWSAYAAYYQAGVTGLEAGQVRSQYAGLLTGPERQMAYQAGQIDSQNSLAAESARAGTRTRSAESGLAPGSYNSRLSSGERSALDALGKMTGMKIQLVQEITTPDGSRAAANGAYDARTNTIQIAMDANRPVLAVAGHEITHRLQDTSPAAYRAFRDYAVRYWMEEGGLDTGSYAEAVRRRYGESGVNLTTEQAMDEMAADFAMVLVEQAGLFEDLARENRSLARRVWEALKDFLRRVKNVFSNKADRDQAARAAWGADMEALEEASRRWKRALEETRGRMEQANVEGTRQVTRNGRTVTVREDGSEVRPERRRKYSLDDGRSAGYNEEQREGGVRDGRTREETRAAFLRRADSEGFTVYEGETAAYGFRRAGQPHDGGHHGEVTREARDTQRELTALGVSADIVDGPILRNRNGVTTERAVPEAVTVDRSHIFISKDTTLSPRNVAGHEAFHLWKSGTGRDAYIETLEDNLLFSSEAFQEYQSPIAEAYLGGEADLANDAQMGKLREELFAYISGDIHDGTLDGELRSMFRDYDAVKAAWEQLTAENGGKARFSLKSTDSERRTLSQGQREYFRESKVVDEEGRLLPVFHATWSEEFTVFDRTRLGENTDWNAGDDLWGATAHIGFWFNTQDLTGQAGDRSEKVYLNLTNPYEAGSLEALTAEIGARTEEGTPKERGESFLEQLRADGYDGVILRDEEFGGSSYVAFDPEQIKRTDNLSPTGDPDIRFSLKASAEQYEGRDLSRDGAVYTYDFLTALPDMEVTALPEVETVRTEGRVDTGKVVALGMKNARTVGTERAGKVFVRNRYTGKQLLIRPGAVRHGLNGGPSRLLTNARLGAVIGDVVQNAVPINALQNKAAGVSGTYAMAAYVTDSRGREFVAIVTVEQYDGTVTGLETYDVTHAVSGRQKKASPVSTKLQGVSPSTAGTLSIADFLSVVNGTHQSILSDDVLARLGETRDPNGFYTGQVLFSQDTTDLQEEWKALRDENRRMRKQLENWRRQARRTKLPTADSQAVRRRAAELAEAYHATMDGAEVAERLQALTDYIIQVGTGDGIAYEDVRRMAEDLGRELVESAVAQNDELYQDYKGLRQRLRQTRLVIAEGDSHDIPNFNDWRKRQFGRLNIGVQERGNVDGVYQELAMDFPEFFDLSITHPSDQLQQIAEVAQQIYTVTEYNPFDSDMDYAAAVAANDVMNAALELPQTRPTRADKAAARVERERARRRMVREILERERKARQAQVKGLRDQYRTRDRKARERRQKAEVRRRIERHARELGRRLIRPTDKAHIPEGLRKVTAALLESINLGSQYTIGEDGKRHKNQEGSPTLKTQAWLKMKAQYAQAAETGEMILDPDLLGDGGNLDAVAAMGDTPLAELSLEQLNTVWKTLRAIEGSISTAGKALSSEKFTRMRDWAEALETDTKSRKGRKGRKAMRRVSMDVETPLTFFSHYGEAGEAIYQTLRGAQDRQEDMTRDLEKLTKGITGRKLTERLERENRTFVTERGERLTLSRAHMMELYLLSRREQAVTHLMEGGVFQPEVKSARVRRGTEAIHLTAADLQAITGALTAQEKQIADRLQAITTGYLAKIGNQASMAVYNYNKFTEEHYWPIKVAREEKRSSAEKGEQAPRSIQNIGMAQAITPGAGNAVDLGGVFTTFAGHSADMIEYAAWLAPMEDMNRLFNYRYRDGSGELTGRTVKGLLDQYGGEGAQGYWHNLMVDIQNGINGLEDTAMGRIAARSIGSFKAAAVGGNIRVIIQQPTAYFRAGTVLSWADLSRGLVKGATKGDGWKKALEYSPTARRKDREGFDIGNARQMKETLFGTRSALQRTGDILSAGAGAADAVTWGKLWNACEWQVAREQSDLKLGSREFYEAVNRVFTDMVDQTQVVDGVLQRSQAMRSSNAIIKQATSFMGEPTMSLNLLLRVYDKLRYEQDPKRRSAAIKLLGRTATALIVTNVVNALAQSLVDAIRDDDEDKKYWERFWAAFTGVTGEEESPWDMAVAALFNGNLGSGMNVLNQVPFVKDALSIMQGYDVTRTEMEIVADLIYAAQTAAGSLDGTGKRTPDYAIKELLAAGAKVFGIPAGNLARDMWGIVRTIAVETDNIPLQYEMEKAIYNLSSESNKGRYYDILFRALSQGDLEDYEHIQSDLMDTMGLDGTTISSAMRARYNTAREKDGDFRLSQEALDLIGVVEQNAPRQESAPGYSEANLGSAAYQSYQSQRAESYRGLVDSLEESGGWASLDEAGRDRARGYADDLTSWEALRDNSGGGYTDADIPQWGRWAAGGEDYGVDETEAILFKVAYEMSVSDKDGAGNTVPGSRKENTLELAEELLPGLTDRELEYLMAVYWTPEDETLRARKDSKWLD